MANLQISVEGISPLLMHSDKTANPFNEYTKKLKALTGKRKKTEDDLSAISQLEWEAGLYWNGNNYFLPNSLIEATILASAKMFKMGPLVKQGVIVENDAIFEFADNKLKPTALYKLEEYIDLRSVRVNQSKVLRCRPLFKQWAASFNITTIDEKIDILNIKQIIENAGKYVGFGDFRPRYGRFVVTEFKELKNGK